MSTRSMRRRRTKTKAISYGKKGQAIKARYSRTIKEDGHFVARRV